MHRLKLFTIPLVGMLVLTLVVFARMGMGNAFAASHAAPLNNCGHWVVNASPNPGASDVLDGVSATDSDNIWAVGYADNQTLTEHWGGAAWKVIPSANESAQDLLVAVAVVSEKNVWAVGSNGDPLAISQAMAKQWNGKVWSLATVPTVGVSSQFTSVARVPGSSNVWAVGHSTDISTIDYTLIEYWNGTAWSIVPSPDGSANGSDLLGVTAIAANNAWAVGTFSDNSGNFESLIEHWNGHAWKVVTSPNIQGNGVLWSVAGVPGSNHAWAVGTYFDSISNFNQTLIAYWNGSSWSAVSSPNVAGINNDLFSVAVNNAKDIWAVGITFDNSGGNHAMTIHWNGSSWSIVSSPDVQGDSYLTAVTHVPQSSTFWAVGTSRSAGNNATITERFC